jgi:hypothetical protein
LAAGAVIVANLSGNATTATTATTASSCTGNAATATTASVCTGNAANITGTLAVAQGGTGATSYTGSAGANVLSASPTLTGNVSVNGTHTNGTWLTLTNVTNSWGNSAILAASRYIYCSAPTASGDITIGPLGMAIGYTLSNTTTASGQGIFLNGCMGIGTSTPAYPLDVNGSIHASGLGLFNNVISSPFFVNFTGNGGVFTLTISTVPNLNTITFMTYVVYGYQSGQVSQNDVGFILNTSGGTKVVSVTSAQISVQNNVTFSGSNMTVNINTLNSYGYQFALRC